MAPGTDQPAFPAGDLREIGADRMAHRAPGGRPLGAECAILGELHHRPLAGGLESELAVDLAHRSVLRVKRLYGFREDIVEARPTEIERRPSRAVMRVLAPLEHHA